jgi:hypothetical protein
MTKLRQRMLEVWSGTLGNGGYEMKLEPSRGQFKRIVVDDAQRPTED